MLKVLLLRSEQCLGPFTMLPSNGLQKQDFLDIYLTTVFGVRNFKNTSAMSVIFLFKMFKILSIIQKSWKKFRESFPF